MVHREDSHPNHPAHLEAFAATNAEVLESLAREVLERFGPPPLAERRIVGIAGAGCVGKSTLAEAIARILRWRAGYDCDWLDLDGYLIEKARRESSRPIISGYNPKGYELQEAGVQLEAWLSNGVPFEVRIYDKVTSERTARRNVQARDLLVVEGVCAFCQEVKHLSSFKVFLEATKEVQYANRWQREKTQLGRSGAQIEQKFQALYPDYVKYILPTMAIADVVLKVEPSYKLSRQPVGLDIEGRGTALSRRGA